MAIDAKILIKQETQDRAVELFGYKRGNILIARSLNKIGIAARQEIQLEIRKDLPLKASDLKKRNIKLKKADMKFLFVRIKITSHRIPLKYFNPRKLKSGGVTYKVRKGGGRQKLKHAFMSQGLGKDHVYERMTKERKPIAKKLGPSVPHVFENIQALSSAVLDRRLGDDLEKMIETQFQVELDRIG